MTCDRVLAGFGLHVGQIKLLACFYFFSGIVEQLFFVQSHTQIKSNEYVPDFDSVALKR